uniref:Uncharacterized protein n=1 Tax=Panagrolaimus davidi TaxID=227884 RepID=A0A914PCQ0_9BILA
MTSKIWLTNKAGVFGNLNSDVICDISSIFSQIYRCDVKEFMCFEYYIFYNAFMFFAEKAEKICLLVANVINNEDSSVALEKLIEGLPNLKDLNYYTEDDNENIITPTTFQKLLKIPHFLTLDKLTLRYIPEVADIDIFSDYIKRNKKTRIHFEFWYELSEQYKTRLQEIIDEIVETEYHEYKVPLIEFQGHTNYTKLRELYGSY